MSCARSVFSHSQCQPLANKTKLNLTQIVGLEDFKVIAKLLCMMNVFHKFHDHNSGLCNLALIYVVVWFGYSCVCAYSLSKYLYWAPTTCTAPCSCYSCCSSLPLHAQGAKCVIFVSQAIRLNHAIFPPFDHILSKKQICVVQNKTDELKEPGKTTRLRGCLRWTVEEQVFGQ